MIQYTGGVDRDTTTAGSQLLWDEGLANGLIAPWGKPQIRLKHFFNNFIYQIELEKNIGCTIMKVPLHPYLSHTGQIVQICV